MTATGDMTDDRFLGGRLDVLQPARGYRAGIDAVMLASAVSLGDRGRALELGLGVGAASLCLLARISGTSVTGVEMQPDLAGLATRNAERNGMADRLRVVVGDVVEPVARLEAAGIAPAGFDAAFFNPPYYDPASHMAPEEASRAQAHMQGSEALSLWFRRAATFLKAGGSVTVIHRAEAMGDLLQAARPWFGALTLAPLWPKAGEAAGRVILSGRRDAKAPPRLLPGLVLHKADGGFTQDAERVLRDGAPFPEAG